jgi:hypothetical protein
MTTCPVLFNPDFVWVIPIYGETVAFVSYDPTTYVMEVVYTSGSAILIQTVGITATNAIAVSSDPEAVVLTIVSQSTAVGFPTNYAAPTVVGNPGEGYSIYVRQGSWCYAPTSYTYQWLRAGVAIPGATNVAYAIALADAGSLLSCQVTAINQYGSSATVTTASVGPALWISGTPVNTATVGTAYAGFTVSALGGTSPYTYSVSSGSLPSGITLNSTTGVVSGTPTASGVFVGIVITATDSAGLTANLPAFSISVTGAASAGLQFNLASNSQYLGLV